jgi:(S)-3,5-dihydroxyphenylglycine transaminase
MITTRMPDPLTRNVAAAVRIDDLHACLTDPIMTAMNQLNEVAERYPDALSFAAGRPIEEPFDVEDVHTALRLFCEYLNHERGWNRDQVRHAMFQYGPTRGIICDLVARALRDDDGIDVDESSIVITVGCQEAMFLMLRALRRDERDVVLAVSPTYIGLTGAAGLVDLPVLPVRSDATGIDLRDLDAQVAAARRQGLRPRALYVVPTFANPTGVTIDLPTRRRLLEAAAALDLYVLEDDPYGVFGDTEDRLPALKALDTARRVVYLGSFAKTALPGARVGFIVADQVVEHTDGSRAALADELSKIKSMVTVNTSPITQAVIAGYLLRHNFRLSAANRAVAATYTLRRRRLIAGLERRFGRQSGTAEISWNVPSGGFFCVLTLPFRADDRLLAHSARRYGVLWTPMSHFYPPGTVSHQMRLSFSGVTEEEIDRGLDRLADLIAEQMSRRKPGNHHPAAIHRRPQWTNASLGDDYE